MEKLTRDAGRSSATDERVGTQLALSETGSAVSTLARAAAPARAGDIDARWAGQGRAVTAVRTRTRVSYRVAGRMGVAPRLLTYLSRRVSDEREL